MIVKSYEIKKINLKESPFVLFYGKNEGLKNEAKLNLLKNKIISDNYEEKEILENSNSFLESIFSKSLFEEEKIIIIKRASDKILSILSEIFDKNINEIIIIIEADILEKKSKLRSFFEKEKNCACVPFYPDNEQTLSRIALAFLKEKKISLSQSDLNSIINKSLGDRKLLFNDLEKLYNFSKSGKKIDSETITKLIHVIENHEISDLINNCLVGNKKKTIRILTENHFNKDDCILITKSFINKLKKILILSYEFEKNKNIDLTISKAKPPIFWKEKDITKQQIQKLKPKKIREIIYKLNDIELKVKKNYENSLNTITDYILSLVGTDFNN